MHNVYQIGTWNGKKVHTFKIASCESSADAIAIALAMSTCHPFLTFEAHVNPGDPGVIIYSFKDGEDAKVD